ncbi:nuclear transport factor 2 family protein [Nocardioides sp. Bht2]
MLALEDRAAIEDLFARYARAVDRCDWVLLRSLYASDCVIDHGGYQGDADGFVDFVRGRRPGIVHTAHYLGQILLERVAAGRVAAEVYGWAEQSFAHPSPLVPEGKEGVVLRSTYRYVDLVERRGEEWQFVETHLVLGDLEMRPLDRPPRRRAGVSQIPSLDDPLYGFLGRWRSGPSE